MSLGSDDRILGFESNLSVNGEVCSFRGASLTVLPDYRSREAIEMRGKGVRRNTAMNVSRLEFLKTAVGSVPRVGETITGEDGRKHTITAFFDSQVTYVVDCELYTPTSSSSS